MKLIYFAGGNRLDTLKAVSNIKEIEISKICITSIESNIEKLNNNLMNLEWGTCQDNTNDCLVSNRMKFPIKDFRFLNINKKERKEIT